MVTMYKVTLANRGGRIVEVDGQTTILEAVEAAGITLPYGCRYGACVTCAGRLLSGAVDQSEQAALKSSQITLGYVLLCVAYPLSDCTLEVGVESQDALYVNPFKGRR